MIQITREKENVINRIFFSLYFRKDLCKLIEKFLILLSNLFINFRKENRENNFPKKSSVLFSEIMTKMKMPNANE